MLNVYTMCSLVCKTKTRLENCWERNKNKIRKKTKTNENTEKKNFFSWKKGNTYIQTVFVVSQMQISASFETKESLGKCWLWKWNFNGELNCFGIVVTVWQKVWIGAFHGKVIEISTQNIDGENTYTKFQRNPLPNQMKSALVFAIRQFKWLKLRHSTEWFTRCNYNICSIHCFFFFC